MASETEARQNPNFERIYRPILAELNESPEIAQLRKSGINVVMALSGGTSGDIYPHAVVATSLYELGIPTKVMTYASNAGYYTGMGFPPESLEVLEEKSPIERMRENGGSYFSGFTKALAETAEKSGEAIYELYNQTLSQPVPHLVLHHEGALVGDAQISAALIGPDSQIAVLSPLVAYNPNLKVASEGSDNPIFQFLTNRLPRIYEMLINLSVATPFRDLIEAGIDPKTVPNFRSLSKRLARIYMINPSIGNRFQGRSNGTADPAFTGAFEIPFPKVPEDIKQEIQRIQASGSKVIADIRTTPNPSGADPRVDKIIEELKADPNLVIVTANQVLAQQFGHERAIPLAGPVSYMELAGMSDALLANLGAGTAHIVMTTQKPTLGLSAGFDQDFRAGHPVYQDLQELLMPNVHALQDRLGTEEPISPGKETVINESRKALKQAILRLANIALGNSN